MTIQKHDSVIPSKTLRFRIEIICHRHHTAIRLWFSLNHLEHLAHSIVLRHTHVLLDLDEEGNIATLEDGGISS